MSFLTNLLLIFKPKPKSKIDRAAEFISWQKRELEKGNFILGVEGATPYTFKEQCEDFALRVKLKDMIEEKEYNVSNDVSSNS